MSSGCAKVYAEKVSGARSDRPELGKLLKRVEAGDLLIVTRLDRLARSTRDLLNILHALTEKGVKFKSLHDPWCDTSTPQGELLVTILAGFATFERHLIKPRTDDGRKRAQARGVRFGRPRQLARPAPTPGSPPAPRQWRKPGGRRSYLWRRSNDDWTSAQPFPRKARPPYKRP
jgi:DNA invertase Pin-like site-specific DNA recombinase